MELRIARETKETSYYVKNHGEPIYEENYQAGV
jgi:hypothetical protein